VSERLETWLTEEVAVMRQYDPHLDEAEYRDALGKTLHAAQLRLADEADHLARIAYGETRGLGDRVYASLKEVSDRARDRSLREWFRRHW
jgi:hypothetical protein